MKAYGWWAAGCCPGWSCVFASLLIDLYHCCNTRLIVQSFDSAGYSWGDERSSCGTWWGVLTLFVHVITSTAMGIKGLVVVIPEAMVFQELNLSQSAIKTLYHDYGYNSKFFQVAPCNWKMANILWRKQIFVMHSERKTGRGGWKFWVLYAGAKAHGELWILWFFLCKRKSKVMEIAAGTSQATTKNCKPTSCYLVIQQFKGSCKCMFGTRRVLATGRKHQHFKEYRGTLSAFLLR